MENSITIRDFNENDKERFKKWLYEPHVAKWYHEPEDWIEEVTDSEGMYAWIHHYIVESNHIPIGFCQYYEFIRGGEDWNGSIPMAGTYSIDYLIGEKAYLKKGYGKAIVAQLIKLIASEPHVKRIIVQPEQENAASCHLLLSSGFTYDAENNLYLMEGLIHEED